MSIKIKLEPNNRDWYTGGDRVKGHVLLSINKETAIEEIRVSFYGISYSNIEKKADGSMGGAGCVGMEREHHVLLDELLPVFPLPGLDPGIKYTLQAGSHTFPFETVLPLYAIPQGSIGSKARQAQVLPPSLSDQGDQMVQYFIKAKVARDSTWGSSLSHELFFTFLPSEDLEESQEPNSVHARGRFGKAWWNIVGGASKSCNSHRWEFKGTHAATPRITYTPELLVSFLVPESLEIGSIELKLLVTTHAKARHLKDTFSYSHTLLKIKPKLQVAPGPGGSPTSIPVDLSLLIPDKMAPSFGTPNLRRVYHLVCIIKYQHQNAVSPRHTVELRLPIQVTSGIATPDWETGFVNEIERTFPMSSDYYTHRERGIAIV